MVDIDKVKALLREYKRCRPGSVYRDALAALEQSQTHDKKYGKCECGCCVSVPNSAPEIRCHKCGKIAEQIVIMVEVQQLWGRVKELEGILEMFTNEGTDETTVVKMYEKWEALSQKDGD